MSNKTIVQGYTRKAYHKSDGTYVHATKVKSYKREAGTGVKTLPKPSSIKNYHVAMPRNERLSLLQKIPESKILESARNLQLLANYTKNSQPSHSKIYHSDAVFLFTKHKK